MSPQLLLSFLALIITCAAITILHKLLRSSQKHAKQTTLPLPPGPTGWPVIGCLPQMIKNKPTFRWIHKLMQENNTEIACIRLAKTYIIPITSPELACEVLRKQDETFASRPECMSAKLASGDDYLTTVFSPVVGDQWKKMRRIVVSHILSPAMHRFDLHIKGCQEADHLVRYVYNQCCSPNRNHGPVNVRIAARNYCSNVMRKLIFGKRFFGVGMADGGPGKEEEEHMTALFTILSFVYGFGIADLFPWLQVFDFDGHKRIISNAINSFRKFQDPEILRRVEMWRGKGNHNNKETEEDILDVLINLKDSKNNPMLSIQEIEAQVIELMLASVDNPSNAAEWAIAEMMNRRHILDKACEELDRVVGKVRLVQESDLPKLNYIKSCIKESFRLHPVAPFNLPHVSTKDTIIGSYFIPKGSHILLSRQGLGRNPRVWEDPLMYRPDRHIIDEDIEVELVDYELRMFSFGTGRRGCPGVVLGTTMATMLLARLLQGFSWAAPLDGPSCIELAESENNLLMVKPLIAFATPRLEHSIYQQLSPSE